MSRPSPDRPERAPLIVLVERANRALQLHMVRAAQRWGYPEARPAHNAVFGRLPSTGARASDLAAHAGITRQSMGELIREMVGLGILEMGPDPTDRRAKLVTYTEAGLAQAREGRRHLAALEDRFAEEFGAAEYETTRSVLERLVGVLAEVETDTD
jgi:DNA-binding MarR family transcriptional regulator